MNASITHTMGITTGHIRILPVFFYATILGGSVVQKDFTGFTRAHAISRAQRYAKRVYGQTLPRWSDAS